MPPTHRVGAQLSGTTLLQNRQNLRHLARDAEHAGAGLEVLELLHIQDALAKQRHRAGGQRRDKQRGHTRPAAVVEHEDGDDDILPENERRLAIGAERKRVADVVGERDEVAAGLEQVREEGHAARRLRLDELDDLGHLDDRRRADDADAEALADGQLEARGILEVDVEQERLVARVADDGHAEVADRTGQVVRDGRDRRAKSVHICGCRWPCRGVRRFPNCCAMKSFV